MTLRQAQTEARKIADQTRSSVLVYRATHNLDRPGQYGVAFTLPMWGERIGNRIYPSE
jgi:hypothetical protein